LCAETAIFRARAGLGIDDGAKMNLVALELFADTIRPRQQIQNVGGRFQIEKPQRFVTGDLATAQDTLAEDGKFPAITCVNWFSRHG